MKPNKIAIALSLLICLGAVNTSGAVVLTSRGKPVARVYVPKLEAETPEARLIQDAVDMLLASLKAYGAKRTDEYLQPPKWQ